MLNVSYASCSTSTTLAVAHQTTGKMDSAGPVLGQNQLVVIDTHLEWIEIVDVKEATT